MSSRKETRSSHGQPGIPDDLHWLAFLYSADELSAEEAERFETRLAEEQVAREALAQAVELGAAAALACEGIEIVSPAKAPANRTDRLRWLSRIAVSLAAGLLIALGIGWWGELDHSAVDSGDDSAAAAQQGELALVWVASADIVRDVVRDVVQDTALEDFSGGDDPTIESSQVVGLEPDEVDVPSYYALMAEIYSESQPPESETLPDSTVPNSTVPNSTGEPRES